MRSHCQAAECEEKRLMFGRSAVQAAQQARSPACSSCRSNPTQTPASRTARARPRRVLGGHGRARRSRSGEAVDVLLAIGIHKHRTSATHPHTTGAMNGGMVLRMDDRGQVAKDEVVQRKVIVCMACTLLRSMRATPLATPLGTADDLFASSPAGDGLSTRSRVFAHARARLVPSRRQRNQCGGLQ